MQMEFAIIEALREPKNRARMKVDTEKNLKEVDMKWNNEKFISSLEILKKEKLVLSKPGKGREVIYYRSSEPQAVKDIELLTLHVEETIKLDYIENQINNFEKNLKELQMKDYLNKSIHMRKIQEHATNIELLLLGRAKICIMLKNGPWMASFLRKEIEFHQKRCEELHKRLSHNMEIFDFSSSKRSFVKQYKEIQKEIAKSVDRFEKSTQYFLRFL